MNNLTTALGLQGQWNVTASSLEREGSKLVANNVHFVATDGAAETKEAEEEAKEAPEISEVEITGLRFSKGHKEIEVQTFHKTPSGLTLEGVLLRLFDADPTPVTTPVFEWRLSRMTVAVEDREGVQVAIMAWTQTGFPKLRIREAHLLIEVFKAVILSMGIRQDRPLRVEMETGFDMLFVIDPNTPMAPCIFSKVRNLVFEADHEGVRGKVQMDAIMLPNAENALQDRRHCTPLAAGPLEIRFQGATQGTEAMQVEVSGLNITATVPELLSLVALLGLAPMGSVAQQRVRGESGPATQAPLSSLFIRNPVARKFTPGDLVETTYPETLVVGRVVVVHSDGYDVESEGVVRRFPTANLRPSEGQPLEARDVGRLPSTRPPITSTPTQYPFVISIPFAMISIVETFGTTPRPELRFQLENLVIGSEGYQGERGGIQLCGSVQLLENPSQEVWVSISNKFSFLTRFQFGEETSMTLKLPEKVRIHLRPRAMATLQELNRSLQTAESRSSLFMAKLIVLDIESTAINITARLRDLCILKNRQDGTTNSRTTVSGIQVDNHGTVNMLYVLLGTRASFARERMANLERLLEGKDGADNDQVVAQLQDLLGHNPAFQFAVSQGGLFLGMTGMSGAQKLQELAHYFYLPGFEALHTQRSGEQGIILRFERLFLGLDYETMQNMRNLIMDLFTAFGIEETTATFQVAQLRGFDLRFTFAAYNDTVLPDFASPGFSAIFAGIENGRANVEPLTLRGSTMKRFLRSAALHVVDSMGSNPFNNPMLGDINGAVHHVVGGVVGLVTRPIEGARQGGVGGFLGGLVKGAVGVVSGAVAGAATVGSGIVMGAARGTAAVAGLTVPAAYQSERFQTEYRTGITDIVGSWTPADVFMATKKVTAPVMLPVLLPAMGAAFAVGGVMFLPIQVILFRDVQGAATTVARIPIFPIAGAVAGVGYGISSALQLVKDTIAIPEGETRVGDVVYVHSATGDILRAREPKPVPLTSFRIDMEDDWLSKLIQSSPACDLCALSIARRYFYHYNVEPATSTHGFASEEVEETSHALQDNGERVTGAIPPCPLLDASFSAIVFSKTITGSENVAIRMNQLPGQERARVLRFPVIGSRVSLTMTTEGGSVQIFSGESIAAQASWSEQGASTEETFSKRVQALRTICYIKAKGVPSTFEPRLFARQYLEPQIHEKQAQHESWMRFISNAPPVTRTRK